MPAGRPTVRSPEIEAKLEQAFALGSTVSGACFFAGIAESTYYLWAEGDKELSERMKALKEKPILKALNTLAQDLDNPLTAKWLLERRHADFKPRHGIEMSGRVALNHTDDEMPLDEATRIYEDNLKAMRGS